jgi:3-deoxy-manno-octulosonate cytidylyltransferase (CMP-KDO synthetase)
LLRELVQFVEADERIEMATAAHPASDAVGWSNPHVVKVLLDRTGRALYFSRAPVPYAGESQARYLRHVGVYAFRQHTLARFVELPTGELEQREGLEQLRALENGIPIDVLVTQYDTQGVDTPDDLKAVASRLARFLESSRIKTRGSLSDTRCES